MKKMKKKWLTVGIPVGVIIVAIILLAFSGGSASPTELVKSFEETIKKDDAKGLVNLVKVDEGIIWSEDYAASIIEHLQNNKTDFEEQLKILNAQASYYEADGQTNNTLFQTYPGDSIFTIGPFYIIEENGFLGNNYSLKAREYQLSVEAPKGTSLTLNGEEIETDREDIEALGMFAPGVYVIEGLKDYSISERENPPRALARL